MERCVLFTVAFLLARAYCHWQNDNDSPLNFQCHSAKHAINRVVSVHKNRREDKRFEFFCSKVRTELESTGCRQSCYWTSYINSYDGLANATCKSNYYINGMHSVHNNRREDRIWRFRCCAIRGVPMTVCVLTGWTNNWDDRQNFRAPAGYVFKGEVSVHNNYREDRLYEYLICKPGKRRLAEEESEVESEEKPEGYINSYDGLAHATCKSNYYIGMHSVHNNRREDRIWKFRCCAIRGVPMTVCVLTGWTNNWDARQNFRAPAGYVFKGEVSVHNNYREDRLYEYLICKPGKRRLAEEESEVESEEKPEGLLEFMGIQRTSNTRTSSF